MRTLKNVDALRGKGYDAIIVGAGFSGAVIAERLAANGQDVLIVEKRNHIGGNCYTEKIEGIDVHVYGSHIFHTNIDRVWNYVNKFTNFNDYKHKVLANTGQETTMLPFTMVTFMQLFNVQTVNEVKQRIGIEITEWIAKHHRCDEEFIPKNFEEQAIAIVGVTIYEKLIKHYTEKQWGRKATELPAEIIKRLPIRWNTDTTYFNNAKYQGIPIDGYTSIFDAMLSNNNIDIIYDDFFNIEDELMTTLKGTGKFIWTGKLDELFQYNKGRLEYRTLDFEQTTYHTLGNYQGTAVVNFTGTNEKFTRITEHKWYSTDENIHNSKSTVITKEYSRECTDDDIPYYPIGDEKNRLLHSQYVESFKAVYAKQGILCGRLADYRYYDMDMTINRALQVTDTILDEKLTKIYSES